MASKTRLFSMDPRPPMYRYLRQALANGPFLRQNHHDKPHSVAGKLVVGVDEDSDDDQPRSRTSSTGSGSGEPKIYHGGPIQELREFFNKMDKVVSGKLIVGETQFNDDSDSDDEDYFKVHAD